MVGSLTIALAVAANIVKSHFFKGTLEHTRDLERIEDFCSNDSALHVYKCSLNIDNNIIIIVQHHMTLSYSRVFVLKTSRADGHSSLIRPPVTVVREDL